MTITGVITAILIGAVVGVLARLILPGKQAIGIVLTVVVGIVAALIGTWLAQAMGISTNTGGVDWLELLVQLVVAVIGVGLVAAVMGRRQRSGLLRRERLATRRMIARNRSTRAPSSRSAPRGVGR